MVRVRDLELYGLGLFSGNGKRRSGPSSSKVKERSQVK